MEKKKFNRRAFISMMAGLTGFSLMVSGLILHILTEHKITGGRDFWVTIHLFSALLFTICAVRHIVYNWSAIKKYIKSDAEKALILSREAGFVFIFAIIIILFGIFNSH